MAATRASPSARPIRLAVDAGVARPLIEGLRAAETVVTDRSGMGLFDMEPIGFSEALERALAEDSS